MTESQREDPLLADLLQSTPEQPTATSYQPPLSRGDEQRLLREANQVGTPTLAPREASMVGNASSTNEVSFTSDIIELVRRYPVPTLLAAVGVAYLLTRRRSR